MTINWEKHFARNGTILHDAVSIGSEELPNKLTPLTADQAAKALSDGYKQVTGNRPNKLILGLLIGQTAAETGNWKSLHNFNFGNAKASQGSAYIQYFGCGEVIDGVAQNYPAGDPHCVFVAYKNAADGAAGYIRTLKSRPHWWTGLQSQNALTFVKALATQPVYFTADPNLYVKVLTDRMNTYAVQAKKYSQNTWLQVLVGTVLGVGALYGLNKVIK